MFTLKLTQVGNSVGVVLPTRAAVTLDSLPVWTAPRSVATASLDRGVRFQ